MLGIGMHMLTDMWKISRALFERKDFLLLLLLYLSTIPITANEKIIICISLGLFKTNIVIIYIYF